DLKPIKAEQYEIGLRGNWNALSYNVALYRLEKDDDILSFTDTATNETQTVNAGRTLHRGIEIGLGLPLLPGLRADVAFSYAKHTYKDWVVATGATPIDFSGNEIESAPRVLANTRLTWAPVEPLQLQLEWVRVGSYYMDAANTAKYSGHNLLNLRARWSVTRDVTLYLNINNLGDKRYADSASISSNTPVFAPGLPRTYYAGVELKW
ncbi:MAG: TonB-dependent receptor, partial [Burkholderiales bacterium]|nr:TonB-dependent receptor [Burkholderiales bacterium]